jgi:adenylate kinase family enzyme
MNPSIPDCGRRISVVGTSGSGKTTLARQISQRLAIPHVELDALHHEPDWQEAPIDVFRKRVEQSLSSDSWVVDGNYSKVRDIVWSRADTVVWLDYSLPVIMTRLLRRTLAAGCDTRGVVEWESRDMATNIQSRFHTPMGASNLSQKPKRVSHSLGSN